MHAIIYNFFNFKNLYIDILNNASTELKSNDNHIIYLIWSYDDPTAFESILNQFKDTLNNERLILITGGNLSFAQSRNLGLFSIKILFIHLDTLRFLKMTIFTVIEISTNLSH